MVVTEALFVGEIIMAFNGVYSEAEKKAMDRYFRKVMERVWGIKYEPAYKAQARKLLDLWYRRFE